MSCINRIIISIIIFTLFTPIQSSIPTIALENPLLNAQSNYIMSYYNYKQFTTSSYFQIDFSQSDIIVSDGQLNVTASLSSIPVNQSLLQANCTSKICIIKIGASFPANTNVQMSFGQFKNPKYTTVQRITVFVYFGVNSNQTQTVQISASAYIPMPVIVNSIRQSDFGVGSQDVTYTINVSFSYVPKDPEVSIQMPDQVSYTNLDTQLVFYGTVQNIIPFTTNNMIVFYPRVDQIVNPNGFMLLTLHGFRNPRFIGTSNSFNVSIVQKKTTTSTNCVTCRVAYLYTNSSSLLTVSSTTPGDITMNIFDPSSYGVSQKINLTIGIKIVAPIPDGGKFRIILPSSIVPVLSESSASSISCEAVYGFTVSNPSYCLYNQSSNTIETVNFSIPYLQTTGDAIIKIFIINPKDNRQTQFNFETLDDQNRKIGKNRDPFLYKAIPSNLVSTISKNSTFLESIYTLSSTITLSQNLNNTIDFVMVTLPPSQFYNLSTIQCMASSVQFNCTKTYQTSTNNLLIKFSPPCSVCNATSVVNFKINNLINPSFINDDMKGVQIQTMTTYGVIEDFTGSIDLKQKDFVISQLNWQGSSQVGSAYKLILRYELPKYIQKYGGYLTINFDQNSSYIDVIVNNTSYTYPQSLIVLNQNNQSILNTLSYYEASKLKSIKQIKIKLCTNDSFCGSSLSIMTLRKSYFPISSANMSFKGQTLNGQAISTSIKDVTSFLPQPATSTLSVISIVPITNTVSNYVFKFKSNKLPFDSGLRIDLTSKHLIQDGRCFMQTSPSTLLGYGIDCQITNLTSFTLTYIGDTTLMTTGQIQYTITVVNVLNPPSLMPITYKIQTIFNSIKTVTYSISYSLTQPYTLVADQIAISNSTYGQASILTLKLRSGYYVFDQLKLYVPKQNYKTLTSFNGVISTVGSYKLSQNSTHFIIEKIYSLSSTFTIQLFNALNTSAIGKIFAQMYVQGYLSSKGLFDLPKITPVYLFTTVSSSNRYIGQITTLNFNINRVNLFSQQKSIKIYFDKTVFLIPTTGSQLFTIDQTNSQLYTFSQQLSLWTNSSKNIILQAFQNMKYIPRNQSLLNMPKLNVSTFDQNNSIVGTTLVDLTDIIPNKTKDSVSYSFTRTSIQSLNYTDLIIDFIPRYPQMAKLLKIQLPMYENRFDNISTCFIGDGNASIACEIVDKQWATITIQYPTITGKIYLKSIWNQFPSDYNLTLTLMTQDSQLIQQSSKKILPIIDLDPLELACIANTSIIASPVQLDFTIKSTQNFIDIGSKIKFTLPDKIYSRQFYFMTKDCDYQIGGVKYTGCQYDTDSMNDNKQWIQYITISNFGYSPIMTGSTIKVTLYLTNPWTSYSFGQKNITAIQFNGMGQQVAKGIILLGSIYTNLTSFTTSSISYYSFNETTKKCNADTILNLTINLPVNIAIQTYFYVTLPSAYYILLSQSGFEIQYQNITSITIRKLVTQCSSFPTSSGICATSNGYLSFVLKATNQIYLRILDPKPKISFYLYNDNNFVTASIDMTLSDRIPSSITGLTLQRSTGNISSKVNSTLKYKFPNTFNISKPTKVSILPVISPINFIKSIDSSKFILSNFTSGLISPEIQNLLKQKQIILSSNSYPTSQIEIQLTGTNPSFAPNVDNQSYSIKIFDDNYIYFTNILSLTSQSMLKPINDGIQIKRSNTLVNNPATYSISGSLPNGVDYGRLVFNQSTTIPFASLTNFINMRIGQFINPKSSNWDTYESVSILNDTHIIYQNNKIKASPSLTSLSLPVDTIYSIQYNKNMRINTQQTLTILFSSIVPNVDKINVKLPVFFKSVKSIKVNSQTIQSYKVSSITTDQSIVEIPVTIPASKVEITVNTLDYQKIFNNSNIIIETQYPTQSYQQPFKLNIYGTSLGITLKMSSYKVNQQNKIQLEITPLNKANTNLIVYLPTFLKNQIQNLQTSNSTSSIIKLTQNSVVKSYALQFNSQLDTYFFEYLLDQASLNTPFVLTLNTIINPNNNQTFYFIVQQQQTSVSKYVFGYSTVQVIMTSLQQIYIRSAQRNTSKIGVAVQIQTQIQIPTTLNQSIIDVMTQQQCVIQMPSIQVTRLALDNSCQVYLLGQNSDLKLSCQMHPTLNNAIITSCKSGLNKYSIRKGFKNMLYSIIPSSSQKPYVYIGQPYRMAQSDVVSTSFLSPIMTSGSLSLNKISSSSSIRLQKTTLSLNMTLQNIQQVDCVNFKFEKQNYLYLTNDLKCKSNGQSAECWSSQTGSIMVNVTSINSNNLSIQINGLVNYITQGNFTIKTLKYLPDSVSSNSQSVSSNNANGPQMVSNPISVQTAPDSAFGLIDIFYSSLDDIGTSFASNSYNTRVISPQNYVSDQLKKIEVIFDDENNLPSALDKNQLQFNITTNIQNCQLTNANFSSSLILNCKFTKSMNFSLNVKLFHKLYSDIQLSTIQFNSFIYPQLSSNCQNQLCDKCSTTPTGQEKCFSCRQNFYQYQNGCIESCPDGYTEYQQYMTCQKCSNNCQNCFGIYWNNCLQCQNSTLVSNDGLCLQSCTSGYAEDGYCLGDNECYDNGCRLCSSTGFCYQCLPDYQGEPTCQWQQLLPPVFMTFFVIPFAIYALISTGIYLFLKGVLTMTYQIIFSFSLLQFSIWIFLIPALHKKEEAMLLISLIVLRIVLGIVAYETYYKKQLNSHIGLSEQESLLEKQKSSQKQSKNQNKKQSNDVLHFDQDWKSRIIRFLSHTNGIDSYEEFKVIFSSTMRIEHNNLYLWISTGNRILVCAFLFYVLSQGVKGDLIILPIVGILSSLTILSLRAVKSKKVQQLWQKLRSSK